MHYKESLTSILWAMCLTICVLGIVMGIVQHAKIKYNHKDIEALGKYRCIGMTPKKPLFKNKPKSKRKWKKK